jgi:hypothetical protein
MKRPNLKQLEATVAAWNRSHPVGTPVVRYKLIAPLREATETKTRSEAWVLSGHSAVVMVEGVSGCVVLESVIPTAQCETMQRPKHLCGCPDCGSSLIDYRGE